MTNKELDPRLYTQFSELLEQTCGIVLGQSKQYLVRSRLTPLLRKTNLSSLDELVDKILRGDKACRELAIEAMTTNETLWFRDDYPFKLLKNNLLKQFANKTGPLRVWSAACSSGQEAYSIAMTFLNYKKETQTSFRSGIEIVGTDISEEMLQQCRQGEYDQLALSRGLPDAFKSEYFEPAGIDKLKIKQQVKSLTQFKPLNLLGSYSSVGRFDIVFCRNVLIYFSPEVKKQILQKIAACLQNDGILFLGASESISELSNDFNMVRCHPGLYYSKKAQ